MSARLLGFRLAALVAGLAWLTAVAAAAEEQSSLGPSVLHLPVLEQQADRGILTPVPIQLDLPPGLPASRVLVHYKSFG